MARKIQVISGDSHLDMPPECWVHHVPARWQERAPRRIKLAKGGDAFIVENRRPFTVVLQITGVPYEQLGLAGSRYGVGTGSPEQRLREQDQDGVDAEILFTHPVYINTWRGITDNDPYKAMIHAYNEWLAEEYCSFAPDRLIAMGIIPDTGVDDAIAEMEYCASMGLKGVCLYKFPNGKGYPLPEDDRFLAGLARSHHADYCPLHGCNYKVFSRGTGLSLHPWPREGSYPGTGSGEPDVPLYKRERAFAIATSLCRSL